MIKSSLTVSELWKSFNWKKASKRLFRLQRRVYKAVQRLVLNGTSNHMIKEELI